MNEMKKRAVAFIIFLLVAGCASNPPSRQQKLPEADRGIAVIEKVVLGGVDQWISVRGQSMARPLLLFLHGGPGVPEMPLMREYNSDLEKYFIVVCWDQRGSGKSFSSGMPPETMNTRQFISDTHELVGILKKRFNKKKIYLVGHSWGSALGMLAVKLYPGDFYAYIGIGQFVNGSENERMSYEFACSAAKNMDNADAMQELEEIGPPVNGLYRDWFNGLKVHRIWMVKLGGIFYQKTDYNDQMGKYMFFSDYSLMDKINLFRGLVFSIKYMWPEVVKLDFLTMIKEVDVPVYFFTGRYDHYAPFELVQKFHSGLRAPAKEIVWFEKSAHCPNFEEPERFNRLVVEKFLNRPDSVFKKKASWK